MPSGHKNATPLTSPLLSCCAAHININETVAPLDDMNVEGGGDQPASRTKNLKPMGEKEAVQSSITTKKQRTQKSEEKQLDKQVTAIYQNACENSNSFKNPKPDLSSKPAQDNDPSPKKPGSKTTTKKVVLQSPSKFKLKSHRCSEDDTLQRSDSIESPLSSDNDELAPKKAVLTSTTNNTEPRSSAKSSGKTATKGSNQKTLSKKNRTEWVIANFGCITVGTTRNRGFSTISLTGFPDRMARKLGNEIAQHAGTRGVRKEREWGYGYEFQLRGDPWGGRKSEYEGKLSADYLAQVVGDGGANKEQTFMRHLVEVMRRNEYTLHLANQALLQGNFYFKKTPNLAKGSMEIMTISFHEPNRLRLTCAPDEFLEAVEDLLSEHPKFRGERKKTRKVTKVVPKSVEYKVPEASWQPWHFLAQIFPEKRMRVSKARAIKLELINLLEEHGWKPIMSSDKPISSSRNRVEHVGNTWYYYRDRDIIKEKSLDYERI